MKKISLYLSSLLAVALFTVGCTKVDDLPFYEKGSAVTITPSATAIAPPAADSNKVVLTLNWTNPGYATDSATVKYVVQIDSAGKNFSNPASRTVTGVRTTSFTAKELNEILLARGYAFNRPVEMDVRVVSSYANNNEQLNSNVTRVRMTPYKIPPKVALPASGTLFLVGGATVGGWNNPVPAPAQQFARIDETTFGGIFDLTPGSYLLLPVNGDWGQKFGGTGATNNSNNPLNFDFKAEGSDLASPTTAGTYKIIVDFQTGKITVTPFTQQHGLPSTLFIVGGATPGGWNNPVPVPSQQLTRINSAQFELASINLKAGEKYLLLPTNGDWSRKFGAENGGASGIELGGPMKPEGADIPAPTVTGNYKLTVDFLTNTYKLVRL